MVLLTRCLKSLHVFARTAGIYMYIPDLYAAIWASTCTIPDLDVSKVKIEGVEIDLLRHLKSKLLLQCGSCIVKIAGFKWP